MVIRSGEKVKLLFLFDAFRAILKARKMTARGRMTEDDMKLANALSERADVQKRLQQLAVRMNNNAKVQEGQKPAEDPAVLLKELEALCSRQETLVAAINLTNSRTEADGVTMTEMLARRDALKLKLSVLRSFLDNASATVDRYSRSEIVIQSTVSVAKLQKQVDGLSKELRELDEKIQELNWTTDLIE